MTIKIIEEPDIHLTRDEHDRLQRLWRDACAYSTQPPSFESFVRSRKSSERSDERFIKAAL